jgi:hypothetical protein
MGRYNTPKKSADDVKLVHTKNTPLKMSFSFNKVAKTGGLTRKTTTFS